MSPCRACEGWSAPYDGTDPSPEQCRSHTAGNDTDEEEDHVVQQANSDPICFLTTSPPPAVLSPTPSSSDTVSTGNQTGRASSALELEWDDIFADDDPPLSAVLNTSAHGSDVRAFTPTPPPLPPQYIQEMRRTATKLVHGSYVEESEFQDDVLVYDLVAQKDTKAAILERIMAANHEALSGLSHRVSSVTAGRTVIKTVSNLMSEDGGEEEDEWRERREDCIKDAEDGIRPDTQGQLKGHQLVFSGFNGSSCIVGECDETDEEGRSLKQEYNISDQQSTYLRTQQPPPCLVINALPNGHPESELPDVLASSSLPGCRVSAGDDFSSRYCELMRSLGVEPDCCDVADDVGTFRKRIRALKKKLQEEDDGFGIEFVLSSLREEEEDTMEEEDSEEEGGKRRSSKGVSGRQGVPFTGLFLNHKPLLATSFGSFMFNPFPMIPQVLSSVSCCHGWRTFWRTPLPSTCWLRASWPSWRRIHNHCSGPSCLERPDRTNLTCARCTRYHTTPTHALKHVHTFPYVFINCFTCVNQQVLVSVRAQIERYVEARPDYPALLTQAWRFLLAKDQDSKFQGTEPQHLAWLMYQTVCCSCGCSIYLHLRESAVPAWPDHPGPFAPQWLPEECAAFASSQCPSSLPTDPPGNQKPSLCYHSVCRILERAGRHRAGAQHHAGLFC